ncbi:hypothetical protein JCM33374_g337 [Metschnikowia sp. JCM 33374]|nr:hypothetical protein JCM33374_g337 [Metschnikowia sp. JCM 33374]
MDEPYYSVPKLHGGGRSGSTKEQFFNTGFKETSATISHKMGSSIKMSVMECDQYSYDSTPWKKTTIRASKADPCSMAAKTWVSDDITVKEETSNGSPLKNEFGEFESSEIVCVESEYLLESSKLFLDKPTSTCETNYANEKSSEKEGEQVEFKQNSSKLVQISALKAFWKPFWKP